MPVDFVTSVFLDGPQVIPYWDRIKEYAPVVVPILASIGVAKYYFRGVTNTWERDMHGKVYMITGGTSGIGATIAFELATKGAQIILLTRKTRDLWLAEYIEDMRDRTSNPLIYAEECDLNSLYSVRQFVTKWLDNVPPRRLDGVICCAAESIPRNSQRQITIDGVERQIGVNYLAHYHLLTLLQPSLQVQPPDRDVRVLIATCSSQSLGELDLQDLIWENKRFPKEQPWKLYGSSKLLLCLFAKHFQKELMAYERKDQAPCNIRINMVNPGLVRTPSMRRFISMGTIWGLILYLIMWPFWWICLKSCSQGAQTFFFGLYSPILMKMDGGLVLQECKILGSMARKEYSDEELQKEVFQKTQELIKKLEVQSAVERKKNKTKEELEKEKNAKLKKEKDLSIQPRSTKELEQKLNTLRDQIGITNKSSLLPSDGVEELPLFPDKEALKTAKEISGGGQNKELNSASSKKSNNSSTSSKQKNKKKT
ncbi:hypothetical protein KGF56_002859 [Candida oxycetoniae]|uniref:Oxidoreductase n=1 Tax=Candida oxycetoniae TaxID=497107 RepID=A0AAI9SX23_9ASCO|nr:uncharacterized protein KGF56_002859 [Candida oxycetoniae]KAI3404339.2 hypothetical protein KGF56_002859 [Candida oxycetoniae]